VYRNLNVTYPVRIKNHIGLFNHLIFLATSRKRAKLRRNLSSLMPLTTLFRIKATEIDVT